MRPALDCIYFYNSAFHAAPPAGCESVDLAAEPAAAHRLIKLGISPQRDLPAMLLAEPDGTLRIVGVRLALGEAERLRGGQGLHTGERVVYSAAWCPDCRRAKRVLEEAEVPFAVVDIDEDAAAEAHILEKSGGRRVVPTILFDGRVWAFNPDPPLLRTLVDGSAKA